MYRSYDIFRGQKDNGFQMGCRVMQCLAAWFLAKQAHLAPAGVTDLTPPGPPEVADPYSLWSDMLEVALWSNK